MSLVNQFLSILVVLSQVMSAILVLVLLKPDLLPKNLKNLINKNAMKLAFAVALVATLGSLFYSDVAGYEPCKLCWYQRILMYPQVLIIGLALYLKETNVNKYLILLSGVGLMIAAYHYLLQIGVVSALPCSAVGYSASCAQRFVMTFGYVTIPMMAASGFLLNLLLCLFLQKNGKH